MKKHSLTFTLVCALSLTAPVLLAEEQPQTQTQNQERIYGSQLMTQEERNEYREKIRTAKTAKERAKIRHEHHQLMMERAKQQGVKLPDEPPARGSHRGMGPGQGMGPRDGMGPGGGR